MNKAIKQAAIKEYEKIQHNAALIFIKARRLVLDYTMHQNTKGNWTQGSASGHYMLQPIEGDWDYDIAIKDKQIDKMFIIFNTIGCVVSYEDSDGDNNPDEIRIIYTSSDEVKTKFILTNRTERKHNDGYVEFELDWVESDFKTDYICLELCREHLQVSTGDCDDDTLILSGHAESARRLLKLLDRELDKFEAQLKQFV